GGSRPLRTASRKAAIEAGPCAASSMLFARCGRCGAEGAAQVALAGLSDVGHGMAGHEGSQSNFRVPESRIVPTATPFDESMPQVGLVEGDPRFRLGPTNPRRAVGPSRRGFFV